MPKLTEGARSAEAFRERRRARVKTILTILAALVLAPLTAVAGMAVPGNGYYLSGTLIVLYAIVPFFVSFEGRRPTAREIAVVAVLTALAVAARAAFIWVPHFKPMAAVIMIAGLAAGPQTGFLVGSVAALASNFIFGQGPWTPWQMFAYGIGGMLAGLFALCGILKKSPRAWRDGGWRDILGLTVFGFLCILLVVGPLLDTSTFFMAGFSASSPLAIYLAGVPVNCVHGSAVALTMLLFGKPLLDRLRRIQIKYGMMEP